MIKALKWVYERGRLWQSLRWLSHALSCAVALSFCVMIFLSFGARGITGTLGLACAAAVPFVLVSVARRVINRPRPYEIYDIYSSAPKKTEGHSFPSRHVFSAALIATLAFLFNIWWGIALALSAAVIAVCRTLCGMHFISDCAAGALLGVLSGVIGILIYSL